MSYTREEQAEHRRLWVKALRGGEYEQGLGRLRHDGRFCCLGVACDISGLGVWENGRYLGRIADLPEAVREWLGLRICDGEYVGGALLDDNDQEGLRFSQIADIIESEPEGLLDED